MNALVSPQCIAPGLDHASLLATHEALATVLCSRATFSASAVDKGMAPTLIQDQRRRLAGFGSALNVYMSAAMGQLKANRTFDGTKWRLRSSAGLDYGSGINATRCPPSTMPCLFAPVRCEPRHTAANTTVRAEGFAMLHRAHRYALVGSLMALTLSPNSWMGPLVQLMEQAVGPTHVAVHLRRGDKLSAADRTKFVASTVASTSTSTVTSGSGIPSPTYRNGSRTQAHRNASVWSASGLHGATGSVAPSHDVAGNRPKNAGDTIKLVNESAIARLVVDAAARYRLSSVVIISDDPLAPAALARELPSALRVDTLVQGAPAVGWNGPAIVRTSHADGSKSRLSVHHVDGAEVGAFLYAAMWTMARARVVVANSGSNMGNLIMSMAAIRTAFNATPILIDMDEAVSTKDLFHGKYLCNLAPSRGTPARYGVCSGTFVRPARDEKLRGGQDQGCW